MTFRIAIRNVRLKSDPSGKVHIYRMKKLPPGRSMSREIAKAAKQEKRWKDKSK